MHINCDACEKSKTIELVDGKLVCSDCMHWAMECEARFILSMPQMTRRGMLDNRELKRGKASVDKLKEVIHAVFNKQRINSR
jgi:hypothetical protein